MSTQMNSQWYVVRTNPRCEGRAEAAIRGLGFETYAPLLRKLIIHHRTKRSITRDFPMLTGYLLVHFPAHAEPFGLVRECDGVRAFLGVDGRPEPLSETTVNMIREIEASEWLQQDMAMRQRRKLPKAKARGKQTERVSIGAGPFSGFLAHVTERKNQTAVNVVTAAFGELVELTFKPDEVREAA